MSRTLLVLGLALAALMAVADAFTASFAPAVSSSRFLGRLSEAAPKSRGGLSILQMAHHVNPKGALKARKNRPKKHSLADINRKPPSYDVEPMIKARQETPEYTVIGQGDLSAFFKVEKEDGTVFYTVKEPRA